MEKYISRFEKDYDEEKANFVLENLVENSDQIVSIYGRDFFFLKFHYDGLLLEEMTDTYKELFLSKWDIQDLKIIK